MATDDEAALAARAAKGDVAAFEALYRLHVSRVHRHCARQLGDLQDAEDLTAVVFLEAWRRRGAVRVVDGSVLPWLLVTATNVARNHRRGLRRYRTALARLAPPEPMADHADEVAIRSERAQAAQALAQALKGLSAVDRQVVSLCLLEELSYAQAAEALGLSHAAVRSRLSRSRRMLREELMAAGYVPGRGEDGGPGLRGSGGGREVMGDE
ncbi:MAG: RNA polymerase sigma factor [Candidatus Nanopelagicales bacterium]